MASPCNFSIPTVGEPTPPEILVERVAFQRRAEAEDRFDATLRQLNEMAAEAREG